MLTPIEIAEIEDDYRSGFNRYQTAKRRAFAYGTIRAYFARFTADHIPRGSARPSIPLIATQQPRFYGCPIYTGPVLIGLARSPVPKPIGPDWIGKPCGAGF